MLGGNRKGTRAFTDAITGGAGALPVASAPARADTSIGSPSGVPVPCTARAATLLGSQPLVTSALATSDCTTSRFSAPWRRSDHAAGYAEESAPDSTLHAWRHLCRHYSYLRCSALCGQEASAGITCCEGPLGEVRLLERPSWLTALPHISASAGRCGPAAAECNNMATMASPRP